MCTRKGGGEGQVRKTAACSVRLKDLYLLIYADLCTHVSRGVVAYTVLDVGKSVQEILWGGNFNTFWVGRIFKAEMRLSCLHVGGKRKVRYEAQSQRGGAKMLIMSVDD